MERTGYWSACKQLEKSGEWSEMKTGSLVSRVSVFSGGKLRELLIGTENSSLKSSLGASLVAH